jgi:hypothetical protein
MPVQSDYFPTKEIGRRLMGLVAERTDDNETTFKRVLDDPEVGGVLMDWYAARVCRPARGKSSNRGLWPSSYTGQSRPLSIQEQPTRNASATASHLGVAMIAS